LRNFFSAFKKIILLVYISGCIENFTIRWKDFNIHKTKVYKNKKK
jgi:hypothetical protein